MISAARADERASGILDVVLQLVEILHLPRLHEHA